MLVVAGQPGHLRIQTDAGNYPLPEGYDYIVLMLAKPEPTEPMVGWLRAEVGGLAALTEPVQGQNVVGQP